MTRTDKKTVLRVLTNLGITAGMLAAGFALCLLLDRFDDVSHGDAYASMIFILAVLLVSRATDGYFYGIGASLIGVLAVNYFFTYPYFAFNFSLPGYPITAVCMLSVSILTCTLTGRVRKHEQERIDAEHEKMRSNLLRAISHDLRTPLTSILGANSALMEAGDTLSKPEQAALHKQISEDAAWLIRLVENLLTVTRIEEEGRLKIHKTPEAVEEVVGGAVEAFRRRYPELVVDVSVPADLLLCPMDPILIRQVLLNLMENAAIHGKNVSCIRVSVQPEDAQCVFSVSDDGQGVTKELVAKLFSGGRYESESDAHRGMGIGLSVCQSIFHVHGGTISAKPEPGSGLTVVFSLPLKEDVI